MYQNKVTRNNTSDSVNNNQNFLSDATFRNFFLLETLVVLSLVVDTLLYLKIKFIHLINHRFQQSNERSSGIKNLLKCR